MHYVKPATRYRIVTVDLAIPEALWQSGEAQDGISALLSDTAGGVDATVADWAYRDGSRVVVAGTDPEEGDLFQ